MSNVKFIIPIRLEDLKMRDDTVNRYVISQEYTSSEINDFINDINDQINLQGPDIVFDEFDKFFGALVDFSNLDDNNRFLLWKAIVKSLIQLEANLSNELCNQRSHIFTHQIEKLRECNLVKMHIFILCNIIDLYEDKVPKKIGERAAKSGKKKDSSEHSLEKWEKDKHKGIEILLKTLVLPLQLLFEPPIVEEQLITCATKCCWKLLENPSSSRNKSLLEMIFHILGAAVEKHHQSLEFCLKIIQLLQHNENLVSVLSHLVETVVKSHKQRLIISEIVEEIERIDIQDLSRDSSGPRAISLFLSEVAEKCPEDMVSSLGILLSFLDQDSYIMRNATLSVIGSIICNVLSQEKMNPKERHLRDELLDKLEMHIADITSFTRGRAIQVWCRICNERKIPIKRLDSLVEAIVGRLQDKSTYVRKNAVVFLSCFLKMNPFADQLNFSLFQEAYIREKGRLDEMLSSIESTENVPIAKCTVENFWEEIESDLLKICESEQISQIECEDAEEIIEKIANSLEEKKLKDAIELLNYLKTNFSDHHVFIQNETDKEKAIEGEDQNLQFKIQILKKIFLEMVHIKDDDIEEMTRAELKEIISYQAFNGSQGSETYNDFDIEKQKVVVRYLRDIVKVIEQIKISVPLVCQLLYSNNILDVKEAVEFFVTAYEFGLKEEAAVGVRKMIVLIFAPEPTKKIAVIEGYKRVFIDAPKHLKSSPYDQAKAVVQNLTVLTKDASIEELISLQELLKELINSNDIDKNMIRVLWERFSLKLSDTTPEESRIAIQLISMIASSNHDLIRDNINTLVTTGLGERAHHDFRLVRYTCSALIKAMNNQGRIVTSELPFRLPKDHQMFKRLSEIIVSGITKINDNDWIPMSEEAIRVIFSLAENPDWICEQIIRHIIKCLLVCDTSEEKIDEEKDHEKEELLSKETATCINAEILSRFLSLIGTIALNLLVHLEINIFTELKTRNAIRDEKKNNKVSSKNVKVSMRRKSSILPNEEDEELDLAGVVTTEDVEAEFISNICNQELVEKHGNINNLLARLAELIVKIASDSVSFSDANVRTSAILTLSKLMCMSENFCSKNLRLLFTILHKSTEPVIRSNTIIALGDLCLLFPNLLDPWTPMLYSSLRDPEVSVRAYTLKVLSRLILSDMIKVKEQISEIAKLILEPEEKLSSFAKLFFTQLSKKQNAIYNILPDIISNLSDPKVGVSENEFCEVMKFLFELIDKDRHTLGLVDKLCQRFVGTTDERQWADIAFCLSIINWTERALIKLIDNFAYFGDKLCINKVYEYMSIIFANAKKIPQQKDETKQALDEFLQKVEKYRNRGVNDELEDADAPIDVTPKKASDSRYEVRSIASKTLKRNSKASTVKKRTIRKKVIEDTRDNSIAMDNDELDEDSFVPPAHSTQKETSIRNKRTNKKILTRLFDKDDDEI